MAAGTAPVIQVVPTLGQSCGISNFAGRMGEALQDQGMPVEYSRAWPATTRRPVLLHFHPDLMSAEQAARAAKAHDAPSVIILHESAGELSGTSFVGSIRLVARNLLVAPPPLPSLFLGHPAWTPRELSPRPVLRAELSLPDDALVIGSSGLLRRNRQFPQVLRVLLPIARNEGWHVYLPTSRWRVPDAATEEALAHLGREYGEIFRYETSFKKPAELNARLQACDLLWTWTNTKAVGYASGAVADHYASGTRMVVSDRPQHSAILDLPNVYRAPSQLPGFLERLLHVARSTAGHIDSDGAPRHDPQPISWDQAAPRLASFLNGRFAAPRCPAGRGG